MGDELTPADFERATHDADFRAFLTQQYGIAEHDLPPMSGAAQPSRHGFASPNPAPASASTTEAPSGIMGFKDAGFKLARQAKLLGRDAVEAATGTAGLLSGIVDLPGSQGLSKAIQGSGQRALSGAGVPRPEPGVEQNIHAGIRGGMSITGAGGPLVALSGATGGMGADLVQQAGGGPLAQFAGGVVGGAVGGIPAMIQARRSGAASAGRILERASKEDAGPTVAAMSEGAPVTERVQDYLVRRVGGQGGPSADRLRQSATQIIDDFMNQERGITSTAKRNVATVRQGARQTLSALRNQEAATVGMAKEQGAGLVDRATRAASGGPVSEAFAQRAGATPLTIQQATTRAEAALAETGRRVFDPLNALGELDPSLPASAAVFDALGNPQVRAIYEGYAPNVPHNPVFADLQRTYRMLGIRGTQAAMNGGETGNTLMGEFFRARDELGAALEKAYPQFRAANAAYRADAVRVEALADGYSAIKAGKALGPDIRQRMADVHGAGGEAALDAYQYGQRRAIRDNLNAQDVTVDAATPLTRLGPDPEERLRTAFPNDRAAREFQGEVGEAAANVRRATATAQSGEQGVARAFRTQRDAVRQRAGEVVAEIQAQAQSQKALLPADRLRIAKQIESITRHVDVPEGGRAIKGMVESAAGASARGKVDMLMGWFGKKGDSETARELLTDLLVGSPSQQRDALQALRAGTTATRRAAGVGAAVGGAQFDRDTLAAHLLGRP